FGLNAALGLIASVASGVAVAVTFGWLVPMTAVCALALAAATITRSANAGVAAGLGGWSSPCWPRRPPPGASPPPPPNRSWSSRTWCSRPAAWRRLSMDRGPREERHERRDRRGHPPVRPHAGRGRGDDADRGRGLRAAGPERGRQDLAAADTGHGH